MTTKGFAVSHARNARFERGLRSFFEYRDLGIEAATGGAAVAHVIRAVPGATLAGSPHLHHTTFQLVYVLKGWIEFEYEGQGSVRLDAGSCVYQPPSIHHRELRTATTSRCSRSSCRPGSRPRKWRRSTSVVPPGPDDATLESCRRIDRRITTHAML